MEVKEFSALGSNDVDDNDPHHPSLSKGHFLPFPKPQMKFYQVSPQSFSLIAPRIQDAFKNIAASPFQAPSSVSTPFFSLRFHKNLEYLNLHAWYLDSFKKVKEDSLMRWQIELRHLRENPQDGCMIQGGPYFKSGPRRIRWMSQNQLFLK